MSDARVDREAMRLIGLEIQTSNERAHEIGVLWQRFMSEGFPARIEGRTGESTVAVYCMYEGDHTQPYTFFLGCPVSADAQVPEGMTARDVPAGGFAHFRAEGEMPGALMDTWQNIWAAPIQRAFDIDYEVHDASGADVYISTAD